MAVKRIIQKLKKSAGFTLAEMLLTLVILLLASSVVAAGVPAAVNAYRNAIDAANAQVLLSAAVNALRNELSTARDVKVDADGTSISYISAATGSRSRIYLTNNADKVIMLQEYDDLAAEDFLQTDSAAVTGKKPDPYALLSRAMTRTTRDSRSHMTVSYTGAAANADGDVIAISGLSVKRGDAVLADMDGINLTIRVLTGGAVA